MFCLLTFKIPLPFTLLSSIEVAFVLPESVSVNLRRQSEVLICKGLNGLDVPIPTFLDDASINNASVFTARSPSTSN